MRQEEATRVEEGSVNPTLDRTKPVPIVFPHPFYRFKEE